MEQREPMKTSEKVVPILKLGVMDGGKMLGWTWSLDAMVPGVCSCMLRTRSAMASF